MSVHDLNAKLEALGRRVEAAIDGGRGGGDDGGMDARITAIEIRLTKIETELQHKASKADVSEAKNSIIMWVVSAILLAQLLPPILKKFGL